MTGEGGRIKNVEVVGGTEGAEFPDGSGRDGHTAAATTRDAWYLRTIAAVMDAEIAMGWSKMTKVATDSQGGIGRILELRYRDPKSWIEELAIKTQTKERKEIV